MPRDGSGIYHRPVGTDAVTDTTIESTKYNVNVADVEQDLNQPRPIISGGTGATSADGVLDNISAEKFKQVVTNWDSTPWRAGSFYAATTATGTAPVASHAFAGIAYYANATDLVLEATDLTDPINPTKYIRIMASGVWGNWLLASGGSGTTGDYTFDSTLTFPPASGQIRFNNATQNSTTELFISHLNALGVDNTGTLSASLKSGYDIFIQDKDEPTKYKIFTATAAPVVTGGDFRIIVALKTPGVDIVSGQRVFISVSTGSAVVYDVAQGLTINQRAQARANIDVTKRNYIINGAMMVSQENGATAGAVYTYYPSDMWLLDGNVAAASSIAQVAVASPAGSPNRIRLTITGAGTATATQYVILAQAIEGARFADLSFGLATAKTVTLQFGCKGPAGTYCVSFRTASTSYVAEFTIGAGEANTDVVKTITVALATTGTWVTGNTAAITIVFCFGAGTSFRTSSNSWVAGNFLVTANQFNFVGTGGNVFELFDVSLTEGTVAPPFQVPDYASELAACKRYWQKLGGTVVNDIYIRGYATVGLPIVHTLVYPVEMRALPTSTIVGTWTSNASAIQVVTSGTKTLGLLATASVTGDVYAITADTSCFISLSARL